MALRCFSWTFFNISAILEDYLTGFALHLCRWQVKVKVKFTLEQPTKAQKGGVEVWLYSFFNLGTKWDGWSTPRPDRFTRGKETQYPLYRRLGRGQCRPGRLRKISPIPGFDARTVQPITSWYTDYAIPAHFVSLTAMLNVCKPWGKWSISP